MSDPAERLRSIGVPVLAAVAVVAAAATLPTAPARLSTTVRAALLFALASVVFLAAPSADRFVERSWAYGLAGATYLPFLWVLVVDLDPGPIAFFLAVVGVPLAVRWLRARASARGTGVAPEIRAAMLALLLVSSGLLVGYDVTGPGPTHEVGTHEEVRVSVPDDSADGIAEHEFHVGRLTVRNEFVFDRPLDPPAFELCVAGDRRGVVRNATLVTRPAEELRGSRIEGGKTELARLYAKFRVEGDPGETIALVVERGDGCDLEHERPTLVVRRS